MVPSAYESAFLDLIGSDDDEKTVPLDVLMKIEKDGTDENTLVVVPMKIEKTDQDENSVVVLASGPEKKTRSAREIAEANLIFERNQLNQMIELMWPHLRWEDLDEKYKKSVQFVRDNHIGVCARCGWSRG